MTIVGPSRALAQEIVLPAPGSMVHLSSQFAPPVLKGIKVYPKDPFKFDFILDQGDQSQDLNSEAARLVRYFLASLTVPEGDLWVNLSPYEKDRIVPDGFGKTQMGRDLLAQDYLLKQITASLIYPEDEVGQRFWKRVYAEAQKRFKTTNIPINTFNKVWILPEKILVYENVKAGTAYVVESPLKVMLEEDYLALDKNAKAGDASFGFAERRSSLGMGAGLGLDGSLKELRAPKDERAAGPATNGSTRHEGASLASQIIREIVIPELTKEINEGKNFAQLRQVYSSLILATWYKQKIKTGILAKVYADKNKIDGVTIENPNEKQKIYERYLQAFKKGVYSYVKEEQDLISNQVVPRKYFSGGVKFVINASRAMTTTTIEVGIEKNPKRSLRLTADLSAFSGSKAMLTPERFEMLKARLQKVPVTMYVPVEEHRFSQRLSVDWMRKGYKALDVADVMSNDDIKSLGLLGRVGLPLKNDVESFVVFVGQTVLKLRPIPDFTPREIQEYGDLLLIESALLGKAYANGYGEFGPQMLQEPRVVNIQGRAYLATVEQKIDGPTLRETIERWNTGHYENPQEGWEKIKLKVIDLLWGMAVLGLHASDINLSNIIVGQEKAFFVDSEYLRLTTPQRCIFFYERFLRDPDLQWPSFMVDDILAELNERIKTLTTSAAMVSGDSSAVLLDLITFSKSGKYVFDIPTGYLAQKRFGVYNILLKTLKDIPDASRIAMTLAKMSNGLLMILEKSGVLTTEEYAAIESGDEKRLEELTQKGEFRSRMGELVNEYRLADLKNTAYDAMLHRLIPMSMVDEIGAYYGLSRSFTISVLRTHVNYLAWLEQFDSDTALLETSFGLSNARHLLLTKGLDDVEALRLAVEAKVTEISDRVGSRANALQIVIRQGDDADDWIEKIEPKVKIRMSKGSPLTDAWRFYIYHGRFTETLEAWAETRKGTAIISTIRQKANAYQRSQSFTQRTLAKAQIKSAGTKTRQGRAMDEWVKAEANKLPIKNGSRARSQYKVETVAEMFSLSTGAAFKSMHRFGLVPSGGFRQRKGKSNGLSPAMTAIERDQKLLSAQGLDEQFVSDVLRASQKAYEEVVGTYGGQLLLLNNVHWSNYCSLIISNMTKLLGLSSRYDPHVFLHREEGSKRYHFFLVVKDKNTDQLFIVDPTYQQFVATANRKGLARVMIIPIAGVRHNGSVSVAGDLSGKLKAHRIPEAALGNWILAKEQLRDGLSLIALSKAGKPNNTMLSSDDKKREKAESQAMVSSMADMNAIGISQQDIREGLSYEKARLWRNSGVAAYGGKGGFWTNERTARNVTLVGLDTIPGFNKARTTDSPDRVKNMVALYREHVMTYKAKNSNLHDGSQAFFYEVVGVRGLMANPRPFLSLEGSPVALLDFVFSASKDGPEIKLIDEDNPNNPDALERWEVERGAFDNPDYARKHIFRALDTMDQGTSEAGEFKRTRLSTTISDKDKIKRMAELYRKYVINYKAMNPKDNYDGPKSFFAEQRGMDSLMGFKRKFLNKLDSPAALIRFAFAATEASPGLSLIDEDNPDALKKWEVELGAWSDKEYARRYILAALDTIGEGTDQAGVFKSARLGDSPDRVKVMVGMYRKFVIDYKPSLPDQRSSQTGFFESIPAIKMLMSLKRSYLKSSGSPAALLIFAIPELVDQDITDALRLSEISMEGRAGTGGIDLNAVEDQLNTTHNEGEIVFDVDPAMLLRFQNASGFVASISRMEPLTNTYVFLGIQ